MGYNLASVRDICKIFASIGGFRGWAIELCKPIFLPTKPRCHGNKIWDKMGYNSAFVKDMSWIFSCSCSSSNTVVVVLVVSAFSMCMECTLDWLQSKVFLVFLEFSLVTLIWLRGNVMHVNNVALR